MKASEPPMKKAKTAKTKSTVVVVQAKKQWCDWCCEPFHNHQTRSFCSNNCKWDWFDARARRRQSDAAEAKSDVSLNAAE